MAKLKGDPLGTLIGHVLLEEKGGASTADADEYTLRWTQANDLGLVIVVAYQRVLQLTYVGELLEKLKKDFLKRYDADAILKPSSALAYDEPFMKILRDVETKGLRSAKSARRSSVPSKPSSSGNLAKQQRPEEDKGHEQEQVEKEEKEKEEEDETAAARARLASRFNKSRKGSSSSSFAAPSEPEEPLKGMKKRTVWGDKPQKKLSKKQMEALDYSRESEGSVGDEEGAALLEMKRTFLPAEGETAEWAEEEEEAGNFLAGNEGLGLAALEQKVKRREEAEERGEGGGEEEQEEQEEEEEEEEGEVKKPQKKGWLSGLWQTVTGNKTLSEDELEPVLEAMRSQLVSKNVASEIAVDITDAVKARLLDQRLASFTRVRTAVQEALTEAITRVLTPKKSTDLLREVVAARDRGKPYSMVFVGINGVGKSTSLAKVAYFLKANGLKVLIAACDTFRSGAVEQLRVHGRCLDIPIFERGYAKDPAQVAKAALVAAQEEGYDCVLIDTAGRMQNKQPLMKALSKLIDDNQPNLVLFVGEALVGNDGVDQLAMFNQALANHSYPGAKTRQIDGIVLTKFDTIDTKVGAALSMCYKTGQPVLFVGTGQKYTHLRKLNVNLVLRALFFK